MDIDRQCEDDDFQLNNIRWILSDVLDPSTNVGSKNMNLETIHTGSNFLQLGPTIL